MNATSPSHLDARALSASRGWLIIGGILSMVVGFIAMGSPYVFSVIIAQWLGIASLALGLMVFARWPNNSVAILGLLFGIQVFLSGVSNLMLGLSARKSQPCSQI